MTLPEGRPVLPRTSANRASLLQVFFAWLQLQDIGQDDFEAKGAEEVSSLLAKYGRELVDAGRPYWHFAETINGVAARRPAIRRQLQLAWDVAFGWMDPSCGHAGHCAPGFASSLPHLGMEDRSRTFLTGLGSPFEDR